ncbi:MAG: hypothetical protein ABW164_01520 [Sphingobium sp.]
MNLQSRLRQASARAPLLARWTDRHWKWLTFLLWVVFATQFLRACWPAIQWFVLSDTDDNMRYLQVKDWLAGQGWYDLRQYRLDPPAGANIHWSRIVDLPLAGLMLFFRAFAEQGQADRLACAVAPLLPLLLLMLSLGFIARRLGGAHAWFLAALAPFATQMALSMYQPMRVDHHGWQLALMVTTLAGLIDGKRRRGGVIAGLCSALSIAIGMEMMVYLAAGGGLIALRWVFRDSEGRRMLPYALALGGGTSLFFLIFASNANRQMMCDALSPIWVAIFAAASAGMILLALLPLRSWPVRLVAGGVVGLAVAAFAWGNWPQCLSGAYQLSPEMQRLWLVNIREAKSLMEQAQSVAVPLLAIPVAGLLSLVWAMWSARRDGERLWAWLTVGLMMLLSLGMLFWALRAGPAAQLLAIPPAAWAAHRLVLLILRGRPAVRAAAWAAAALLTVAICAYPLWPKAQAAWAEITGNKPKPWRPAANARTAAIKKANGQCRTLPALEILDQLPPATIFTMVDMGPRLIAMTHHSAVAGPYHRNEKAILDIHHAFDRPARDFRAIAAAHHATYLLVCPNFPEGTIYSSRSPRGFYADLMRGTVSGWLHRVTLKTGMTLPYQLYRIDYSAPASEKGAQQR